MSQYAALQAREIDSAEKWHAILQQLPTSHPLQSWAWGELKARWGWSMHPTAFMLDGVPHAAALILKRQLAGPAACILYTPKGPILDYANIPLRDSVLRRLQQIARNERAIFLKLDPDVDIATGVEANPVENGQRLNHHLISTGWRYSADQIQFRNTVTLDLTRPTDDIMKAMKSKTRYNIRLSRRKEITVRQGTEKDLDLIAAMYAETSERDGFAIRPKAYYLDAWRTFSKAGMLQPLIAEYQGDPLAAVMIVHYGKLALYMYGASTTKERNRMPTYLLQWEAICWAKAQGCTTYDFWGAPDNFNEDDRMWGVWRFKKGFNGTVHHTLGAWDYPPIPALYKLYTEAVPRYLAWLRSKAH